MEASRTVPRKVLIVVGSLLLATALVAIIEEFQAAEGPPLPVGTQLQTRQKTFQQGSLLSGKGSTVDVFHVQNHPGKIMKVPKEGGRSLDDIAAPYKKWNASVYPALPQLYAVQTTPPPGAIVLDKVKPLSKLQPDEVGALMRSWQDTKKWLQVHEEEVRDIDLYNNPGNVGYVSKPRVQIKILDVGHFGKGRAYRLKDSIDYVDNFMLDNTLSCRLHTDKVVADACIKARQKSMGINEDEEDE